MVKPKFLELDFYKEALQKHNEVLNTISSMKMQHADKAEILGYINKNEVSELLRNGKFRAMEQANAEENKLKQKYDTQREYVDPQLEILQRQDWDLKLSNMSNEDLNEFITSLEKNEYTLSNYQAQTIKNRLANNPESVYEGSRNQRIFETYLVTHHIGKEYERTLEWEELQEKKAAIGSVMFTYLYKPSFDGFELIDYQSEYMAAIADYQN